MKNDKFVQLVEEQIARSRDILAIKQSEYATEDRLHNFKVAAALQDCTMKQVCGGFLAKHIVSVYDMIRTNKDYTMEHWNEKITDSINYLLLLRAIVEEPQENRSEV